jgi:hypothetical protein
MNNMNTQAKYLRRIFPMKSARRPAPGFPCPFVA